MIKEWFYNNISQPISKFYHKYIMRETEQHDNITDSLLNTQQLLVDEEFNVIPQSNDQIV